MFEREQELLGANEKRVFRETYFNSSKVCEKLKRDYNFKLVAKRC